MLEETMEEEKKNQSSTFNLGLLNCLQSQVLEKQGLIRECKKYMNKMNTLNRNRNSKAFNLRKEWE